MTILGKLEPREIEGADEVLPGMLLQFNSGNQCYMWPALTYDPALDQTRIGFFTGWKTEPSNEDTQELMAYTNDLMGKPPDAITAHKGDPFVHPANTKWLATGEKPKVQ